MAPDLGPFMLSLTARRLLGRMTGQSQAPWEPSLSSPASGAHLYMRRFVLRKGAPAKFSVLLPFGGAKLDARHPPRRRGLLHILLQDLTADAQDALPVRTVDHWRPMGALRGLPWFFSSNPGSVARALPAIRGGACLGAGYAHLPPEHASGLEKIPPSAEIQDAAKPGSVAVPGRKGVGYNGDIMEILRTNEGMHL